MAEYLGRLDAKVLIGVGAAFDIHTGSIKDAPDILKKNRASMGAQAVSGTPAGSGDAT